MESKANAHEMSFSKNSIVLHPSPHPENKTKQKT